MFTLKKIMKKFIYLFSCSFITFFVFAGLASAQGCDSQIDKNICNPKFESFVQSCQQCDPDPKEEWCNIEDCSLSGKICAKGICASSPPCGSGQLLGDMNGNGVINGYDVEIIKNILAGELAAPSDLCCIDMDKDGGADNDDLKIVEEKLSKIEKGEIVGEERCETICNQDGACNGKEDKENCPADCLAKEKYGNINNIESGAKGIKINPAYLIIIFVIIVIAVVSGYFILAKRKNKMNLDKTDKTE